MLKGEKMAELKYQKYIVNTTMIPEPVKQKDHSLSHGKLDRVIWLDDRVVKGAFQLGLSWYLKPLGVAGEKGHTHDFDELLAFIGSDWQNPTELYGEVEFWMEDEKYILTKSCVVFIPKGLRHCPLKLLKSDRPLLHFGVCLSNRYSRVGTPIE
jgi:hypothetical protein